MFRVKFYFNRKRCEIVHNWFHPLMRLVLTLRKMCRSSAEKCIRRKKWHFALKFSFVGQRKAMSIRTELYKHFCLSIKIYYMCRVVWKMVCIHDVKWHNRSEIFTSEKCTKDPSCLEAKPRFTHSETISINPVNVLC